MHELLSVSEYQCNNGFLENFWIYSLSQIHSDNVSCISESEFSFCDQILYGKT